MALDEIIGTGGSVEIRTLVRKKVFVIGYGESEFELGVVTLKPRPLTDEDIERIHREVTNPKPMSTFSWPPPGYERERVIVY